MLGLAIEVSLVTLPMLRFGWRWMFACRGLAGLLLAAVFYRMHRDPAERALLTAERAYLDEGGGSGAR